MNYYHSFDFIICNYDCDPKEITKTLKLKPSKIWRKGGLTKFKKSIKKNSWSYNKTFANNHLVGKNILNFLKKIKFEKLKDFGDIYLQLSISTDETNYQIEPKILKILVDNNITLEYVYQK